jgi:DNA invertase Pin-like site-specific DNA recombinase
LVTKGKRAALYLRVSTDGQTVENQRRVLEAVAERRGWAIVATYEDAGISGAKSRASRPGFNAMLNDATRRRFDILLFWSIDRLGRSTAMVATALAELEAADVAIYADKEAVDATTPHGRAMLQMAAVFGELERAMIRERVIAGLARAKAESPEQRRQRGKKAIGRPRISAKVEAGIRDQLALGRGILRVAREIGVGVGTVHRIKRTMIPVHSQATLQSQG